MGRWSAGGEVGRGGGEVDPVPRVGPRLPVHEVVGRPLPRQGDRDPLPLAQTESAPVVGPDPNPDPVPAGHEPPVQGPPGDHHPARPASPGHMSPPAADADSLGPTPVSGRPPRFPFESAHSITY